MSKIVFIAPHFDDFELSMGATAVKLCERGNELIEVAMTDSEEGNSGNFDAKKKREEGLEAAKLLGLKTMNVYSKKRLFEEILFPGLKFESFLPFSKNPMLLSDIKPGVTPPVFDEECKAWRALYDMRMEENGSVVIQTIIKIVRFFKPDVVVSVAADFHVDHRALAKYVKEGVYQSCRRGICGSTEDFKEPLVLLAGVDLERPMSYVPQVYSEITKEQLDRKIEALQCYPDFVSHHPQNAKSIFGIDHARDWCWAVARLRGVESASKTGLAESFKIDNLKTMFSLDTLLEHIF